MNPQVEDAHADALVRQSWLTHKGTADFREAIEQRLQERMASLLSATNSAATHPDSRIRLGAKAQELKEILELLNK